MDTYIKFNNGTATGIESYDLDELASLIIDECDTKVKLVKAEPVEGVKDGGLTIGIAVVGLALSGISTLIAILAYWQSQKPKYSASITLGNKVISIENITLEQLQMIADEKPESQNQQLEILISQKQSAS